jgi:hypothetical protein
LTSFSQITGAFIVMTTQSEKEVLLRLILLIISVGGCMDQDTPHVQLELVVQLAHWDRFHERAVFEC